MNPLKKLWYHLTAYVPRRLPRDEAEFEKLKTVLVDAYGVSNEPATWATVAGHITSVPAVSLRRPWGSLANAAKRLHINQLAQNQRQLAMQDLQERFARAAKDFAEEEAKNALEKPKEIEPKADAVEEPKENPPTQEGQTVH